MNFELGKTYIVEVTENGIIPTEEFDESRWYDKDHDDLDFLTDEEKAVVVIEALEDVRAEITGNIETIIGKYDSNTKPEDMPSRKIERNYGRAEAIDIINRKIKEIENERSY